MKGLLRAKKFIAQMVARGEDVLFVGTKRQARLQVQQQAQRVGMPYVIERWLGGTLTNFRTIRSRLARLEELEKAELDGTALEYSKKMIASRKRELAKIKRNLEGIRTMTKLPGTLVVIDVHRATRFAKRSWHPDGLPDRHRPDPDFADIPIPGNDDAIRAIDTILVHLGDAVEEGKKPRATWSNIGDAASTGRSARARRRSQRRRSGCWCASGDEAPAESVVGSPTTRQPGFDACIYDRTGRVVLVFRRRV